MNADGVQEKLYKKLILSEEYDRHVRPIDHHSRATNITIGFLLNQIVEMDERNQILTTRSWLNLNWIDSRLQWNASERMGIKTMYLPDKKLWKPDIILVNNAAQQFRDEIVSTDIVVTDSGNITWLFSAIFKSSCHIKVRYYPFDEQECELRFASWSHTKTEIDLELVTEIGDLSSFMNSSEFDLLEMSAMRKMMKSPVDPSKDWPMIIIKIRIRRHSLFYVFNHLLPCILISSMAILSFFMPPETNEKVTMCVTTLLSMCLFLQSITESIPHTSEAIPLIVMYYIASLSIICLTTFTNVVILNVHRSSMEFNGAKKDIPKWIKKYVIGYLAPVVGVSMKPSHEKLIADDFSTVESIRTRESRGWKEVKNNAKLYTQKDRAYWNDKSCKELTVNGLKASSGIESDPLKDSPYFVREMLKQNGTLAVGKRENISANGIRRLKLIIRKTYTCLQMHHIREQMLDEERLIMSEWHQVATVVDRFLLLMFSVATVLTASIVLATPKLFSSNKK